ncbi:MAG: ShlB/FhaC/HecB family hemolysin secretion/activation protein [Ketobacter sp.]
MADIARFEPPAGRNFCSYLILHLCTIVTLSALLTPAAFPDNLSPAAKIKINPDVIEKAAEVTLSPSTVPVHQRANFVDGKVLIKRIELKGDALFPEYGVTRDYINNKILRTYQGMEPLMSISDMHYLADTLTNAYHEKGLTFNQVFVVPDEIKNDTLSLNILAGKLSEIQVKNNELFNSERITSPFEHLLGQVVYEPAISEAMKKANSIPGLKVFGFFSLGNNPGQTRLNLHVLQESDQSFSIRSDNFGVNSTGIYRLIGQYTQYNISGKGDTLSGTIVSTNEWGNLFGSLTYQAPHFDGGKLGATFYSNLFEVTGDFQDIGLNGHLEALSVFGEHDLLRQNNALASLSGSVSYKHSVIDSDKFGDIFADITNYLMLDSGINLFLVKPDGTQKQSLSVSASLGQITSSDNENSDDSFVSVHVYYGHQLRWIADSPQNWSTGIDVDLYYTPDHLPASERQVMTGPYAVRSYEPALFSADSMFRLSLHQNMHLWNVYKQINTLPFFFLDFAEGKKMDGTDNTASFLGVGIGVDFLFKSAFYARLTLGFPVQEKLSQTLPDPASDVMIYGYVNITF